MIIPSIDLLNGKAVQLQNGKELKFESQEDIMEIAQRFSRFGPLSVIDLNGAINGPEDTVNVQSIKKLCSEFECRIGGGIRSVEKALEILSWGATKIIVGSKAFDKNSINTEFLDTLTSKIKKDRVIIAIDAVRRKIVTHGWLESSDIDIIHSLKLLENYAGTFLFTSVENEGCLAGIDIDTLKELVKNTSTPLIYAGGIKSLKEIEVLSKYNVDVQVGMALYTGLLDIKDMFCASITWEKGLIPAIVEDESGQILMQAYMSKESCLKSFYTGEMWYFSRSRNNLWNKGEKSGNKQILLKVRTDCDNDSLLFTVAQHGNACHKNQYSCFSDKMFSLDTLYEIIEQRIKNNSSGSYTASLSLVEIRRKIMEEAFELTDANTIGDIIWEAADCFYFILTYCAKHNVSLKSVVQELSRRRKQ